MAFPLLLLKLYFLKAQLESELEVEEELLELTGFGACFSSAVVSNAAGSMLDDAVDARPLPRPRPGPSRPRPRPRPSPSPPELTTPSGVQF